MAAAALLLLNDSAGASDAPCSDFSQCHTVASRKNWMQNSATHDCLKEKLNAEQRHNERRQRTVSSFFFSESIDVLLFQKKKESIDVKRLNSRGNVPLAGFLARVVHGPPGHPTAPLLAARCLISWPCTPCMTCTWHMLYHFHEFHERHTTRYSSELAQSYPNKPCCCLSRILGGLLFQMKSD